MGLLNPGGPIAQSKRNDCSISPVELISLSGVRKQKVEMDIDDPMIGYIHSIQTHDTYTLYSRTYYVKEQPIVVRDKNLGESLQYIIPQKRAVILLSYFAGYNDTEVANILGVSPTSIARRKKSALLRLRELLEVRVNDE